MSIAVERALQRCARLLMLNTSDALEILKVNIYQVIQNILNNPAEEKYRTLKTSNAAVKAKLLNVSGGNDLLHAIGFKQRTSAEGVTAMVLDKLPVSTINSRLTAVKAWLEHNIPIFQNLSASGLNSNEDSKRICCEVVVNIRLPTGTVVSGGFLSGDTLFDVYQFASTYFDAARATEVRLFDPAPGNSREFGETEMQSPLAALWSTSRVTIFATLQSPEEQSKSMKAANTVSVERDVEREKKVIAERQKRVKEQEKLKMERERVLRDFHADRKGKQK